MLEDRWWGRAGVLLGLFSAISYLVGVIVIAEFTRPMGLAPSDLGLGIREYTIIAALALLLSVSICASAGLAAFAFWAVADRQPTSPKLPARHRPRRWGLLWMAVLFLLVTVAAVPLSLLFGTWLDDTSIVPATLTFLPFLIIGQTIGADLSEFLKKIRKETAVIGDKSPSEPRLYLAAFRGFGRDSRRVVLYVLSVLVTVAIATSYSASRYADKLLSGDTPVAPLLVRYVLNPSHMCAKWSSSQLVPSGSDEDEVIRVGRGTSGEVVILDGRAWLVDPADVLLASKC